MNNPIQLPLFFEGQILNSDDLGATVDYAREQLARHDRYMHTWGIASGFELNFTSSPNPSGTSVNVVMVSAGVAYDGRGREIVLTQDVQLDPTSFMSAKVYDESNPSGWYAVYIQGIDDTPTSQPSLAGSCAGASQATRQGEDVQFNFSPPFQLSNSTAPYTNLTPGDTADATGNVPAWNILIGFVQWNDDQSSFTAAQDNNGNGVTRRLAGVQASRVEALEGTLTLQTSDNPNTMLQVVVQEAVGSTAGTLKFGSLDQQGNLKSLLTVDDQGNVSIAGNFTSAAPLAPGRVSIQSGIATDGMTLPLPSGVTDDNVSQGNVLLHIQVSPIVPEIIPNTTPWLGASTVKIASIAPQACYVDSNRRVRCSLFYQLIGIGAPVIVAGMCHYTIMAVPAAGGTSS
jgi:hypothetical protein